MIDRSIFSNNLVIQKLTELRNCIGCALGRRTLKEWTGTSLGSYDICIRERTIDQEAML
jgi:hypothetical protein